MTYLDSSKGIIEQAIKDYQPYACVGMFSGGSDSLAMLEVCNQLDIKLDFIIHGVTGTGIKETHDFVKGIVSEQGAKYLEANAGDTYVKYVLRKGFFGVGEDAHNFTYHLLKWTHFRRVVSQNIRHKKRGRNILFINGTRRLESARRMVTQVDPVRRVGKNGSNIWVNIINEWPNEEVPRFLEGNSVPQNPVSKQICRSGECNCGSMLSPADRIEIGYFYPKWKQWLDDLSKAVKERGFYWDWAESMPKGIAMERKGQINMFQPMCSSCVIQYKEKQTPP